MQISNPNEQSEEITNKQRELKNLEEKISLSKVTYSEVQNASEQLSLKVEKYKAILNESERAKYEEKIMQLESVIAKAINDANTVKTEYQEKLHSLESTNSITNKQLQELSNNIEKLTQANSAAKNVSV